MSSPTAKLLVTIKSFAAETERLKTSARTHESLTARAERGWVAGGAVYGYSLVPIFEGAKRVRTEYAIDEEQAKFVREIWERHWLNGDGYRKIALDLNARRVPGVKHGRRGSGVWCARRVHEVANNERYLGKLEYGVMKKTYKKGTKVRVKRDAKDVTVLDAPHLRLVSTETEEAYRKARTALDAGKRTQATRSGPKARHLLAGIARCGICGGPMQGDVRRGVRYYPLPTELPWQRRRTPRRRRLPPRMRHR